MAKKKNFDVSSLSGGKSIVKKAHEIEMKKETKDALLNVEDEPTKEKITKTLEIVRNDEIMQENDKNIFINLFKEQFIQFFNFDNCPDDYFELKKEAAFLSGVSQYSFLLMAQRLKKIRDKKLYILDGYEHFKDFIEKEISIAKRTSYDYISIVECFGVRLVALGENVEYSKLLPIIPLLKNKNNAIPKEELKDTFLKDIFIKSKKEIIEQAKQLKIKYGLINKTSGEKNIEWIDKIQIKINNKIGKITDQEKEKLITLADLIYKHFK